MASSERISGEETKKNNMKAGSFKPNPTRYNRKYSDFEFAEDTDEGDKPEINPGKLDRNGSNNSPSGDRSFAEKNENKSVKKPKPKENLLGQGGYGTSGTSGTNSGGQQGYQSGLGSAGSQNGSTGYNAGSQAIDQTKGA